jgi:prevent-host-death family protein
MVKMLRRVNLAEAKAHLSALVRGAAAGDEIEITSRGKPLARLVPVEAPRRPIDLAELQALTAEMPPQPEDSVTLLRRMRDEARY